MLSNRGDAKEYRRLFFSQHVELRLGLEIRMSDYGFFHYKQLLSRNCAVLVIPKFTLRTGIYEGILVVIHLVRLITRLLLKRCIYEYLSLDG